MQLTQQAESGLHKDQFHYLRVSVISVMVLQFQFQL